MTEARLVGDRYEMGELLGYGGMAEVHRGKDVRLGRDVAVKELRADLARDPSFQNRFRREAQASAGLNHPAIVAVYDTGDHDGPEGQTPYIVMEFVEGRTLREVLKTEGHLPALRAMEITAEVCSALDFSHRSGIVHRDIKPGNVMITNAGAVKVMDFGIARALGDGAATVTATSAVIGTAQYLSPEQARGESVDARSDVYSTGCLLYELLTGHPPFTGDSPVAVAYQHVRENAQIPSSVNNVVPKELDSIVMKALAKNPLNRYQTAAEMRADLQRAIAGQAVEAESVMTEAERTQFIAAAGEPAPRGGLLTPVYDDERDTKRGKGALIWTAVLLALLLVIGVAGWAILRADRKPTAATLFTVEGLAGLSPKVAEQKIRDAHLTVVVPHQPSNGPCKSGGSDSPDITVTKGQVCTQDPAEGTQLEENQPVKFTVYAGPANVQVPSLIGYTFAEANDRLNQANLKGQRKDVASNQPSGAVVDQNPPAFTSIAPQATVVLSVSNGKSKLPNVLHLSEGAAKAKLTAAGFQNFAPSQTAEVTSGFNVGEVMAVNPVVGSSVDRAAAITLTIAVPRQLPKCSPTPTPTPTPKPTPTASGVTIIPTPTPVPTPTPNPTCTP